MCSLLSTSFKFSPCGCVFHTFSVFVALSCAFLGKILLFSAQTAVSSSDALQPFSRHLGDYSLGSTPGFLLLGLHHKVWAPRGTISASPLFRGGGHPAGACKEIYPWLKFMGFWAEKPGYGVSPPHTASFLVDFKPHPSTFFFFLTNVYD